jgi:beta-mannosidase
LIDQKLTKFELSAYYPHVPEQWKSVETGGKLSSIFDWIPAEVPGSIHHDLLEAGMIRDPYYEMQSMESEWIKDRWWIYRTDFNVDASLKGKHLELCLKGIDYKGHVSLNHTKLGSHAGMYNPFVVDITGLVKFNGLNHLEVMLESAPDEMGQIGYTDKTATQKARFVYKWDWCPRMVHLGLYDDVTVNYYGKAAIRYSHIQPMIKDENWILNIGTELEAFQETNVTIIVKLLWENHVVAETDQKMHLTRGYSQGNTQVEVENPYLWNPRGHGEQNIYQVLIEVLDEDGLSDCAQYETGFRTLEYVTCENAAPGSLPYNVVINGKKIYVKGVNMTPLDMMYGSVTEERYKEVLRGLVKANINLVRVWGGGLIEKEIFYRICDELGIMVWQEFIQSSSGISNVPSELKGYLELLKNTAKHATKEKRNHVSLTYWSGGNELTDSKGIPVGLENPNIRMLAEIVRNNDPDRLFLPTSASGPLEFLDIDQPGKNHDVHGGWKYYGTEEHYRIFNRSDSQLHSEFGVDGTANYETLCTFLEPKNRKAVSMGENIVWRHHGEWWDTYGRDSSIFGKFAPDELKIFIKCSQFIQGEGIRYAVEANRRRMFQNCGNMIWQYNEPWPNASGTNIMDYYNRPKLAYWMLRDAYRPISPSLSYNKLIYRRGEIFEGSLYIANDQRAFKDILHCKVMDMEYREMNFLSYKALAGENCCVKVEDLTFAVPESDGFIVELSLEKMNIVSRYFLLTADNDGFVSKKATEKFVDWYQSCVIKEENMAAGAAE